jgi:PKD domain-containing protein
LLRGSPWARVAFVLVAAFHLSCGGAPTAPQHGSDVDRGYASATSKANMEAGAQNLPPNFVLRTTPPADASTIPFPTISGEAPLAVRFNLCRSDDPDPEDSLNYQFSFGDSGRPAFNPDGTFAPDFDHFCRTEHLYGTPGTYTATVSVTDKHLEDQSRQVVAFARRTQSLTIVVVPPGLVEPAPHPGPSPSPNPSPTPMPRLVITIVTNNAGMSYSPNPAVARAGQRIVWVNADGTTHTATEDGGAFDTGFVAPGATSGGISLPAGTFPYHCAIHPSMVATLDVVP